MSDIIRQWVEAELRGTAFERERQIHLALQPRPRWLQEWVWKRIIARLLVIEEHPASRREET